MDKRHRDEQPKLRKVLREDMRRGDFWSTLRKDFRDLKEFYISDDQRSRLQYMGWLRRSFFVVWWLLKSMMLNLAPGRRLLIFLGVILVFLGPTVTIEEYRVQTRDWHMLGGAMLILVLMLELKDKLLARDELEAGRKIQVALMPPSTPEVPGWSVWLFSRPANEVGGDLVDFLRLSESRVGIALGDVAGKGLKAALLMAKIQATMRALAPDIQSLARLGTKINEIFHRDSVPGVFASLLYMTLGDGSGRIRFFNAGHLPPMLVSGKTVRELGKGNTALGLVARMKYAENSVRLKKGELLFGYSDGLVEARNEQGEFYGTDRLLDLLRTTGGLSAPAIGEKIIASMAAFKGDARATDDMSIVIVKHS